MILDVFDKDLFFNLNELRITLDDSYYVFECHTTNNQWTFLCYYIQENKSDNIKQHKKFFQDFTKCLEYF